MLRSIGWIALLLVFGLRLQAQDLIGQPKFDQTSKAPEVQKMQKAIDVPVSYFTGSANISIPVHTISSKGNQIPLSLEYQTGGIKPEEVQSYVGLGWTLNCNGYISRTIRGNKDEGLRYQFKPCMHIDPTNGHVFYTWDSPTDSLAANTHIYGGFYIDGGNSLYYPDLYTAINTHNQTVAAGNIPTTDQTSYFFNGLQDGEPDIFYINCGGFSGKFIFDGTKTAVFMPYSKNMTVTPVLSHIEDTVLTVSVDTVFHSSFYFSSFKVSAPDGKDYYFGETSDARINRPDQSGDGRWCITSWLLTRVIDRTSMDTVTFTYTGSSGGYTTVKNVTRFLTHDAVNEGCINQHSGLGTETQPGTVGRPMTITTSKEILNFYYSGFLDSIKVVDKLSGNIYKKLQFDYATTNSGRYKLVGFMVKDLKTNEFYPYSFTYYDTAGFGGLWAQDYWGYHNGAGNNGNLFPNYPGCTTTGANRDPAWPAMKIDALTEVIYPTGGKTILEYEPHMAYTGRKPDGSIVSSDAYYVGAYNNFSLPAMIGGMRVRRILNYDPVTKDTLIRHFSYLIPGSLQSSGFLYIPPKLLSDISSFACPASTSGVQYYISTHPVYQGAGTGPHVSYKNVQVQEEKNGVINGHTEYDFYDDTNTDSCFFSNAITDSTNTPMVGPYDVVPEFMFRKLPDNFLSGKEKEKRVYNANGDLLLKERSIYKSRVYSNQVKCSMINSALRSNICGDPTWSHPGGGGGEASGTYIYEYDETDTVSHTKLTFVPLSSGSNTGKPVMAPPQSYYFIYPYTVHKTGVALYQKIVETHPSSLAFTIDTTTYSYDNNLHMEPSMVTTRNSKAEVTQQRTLYSLDFNDVNSGDSTFYFLKKAGMNVPIGSFSYKNGNIISGGYRQYRMRSRIDSTIFLIDNEYSLSVQNPGLTPASINVGSTLPQSLNFPSANFLNVASYKYNSNNTLGYIIKKGNNKIVFLWDYNNNYIVTQAAGADSIDIAFTGFETSYNGTWTVAGTPRVTTSALTGKQSYTLSSGNITRTGLNSTKSYIVSYWSLTSAATVNSTTATTGNVKKGWHYFEHKLPVGTTSVTISGAVTIDELRLYPADALITTYAFDPLIGVTAIANPNSTISYYEYDGVGKLRFIRDADNNIVKAAQYFYTVYGKDTAIWRSAGGSTRLKPCSANTSFNDHYIQKQQVDINPNSSTYRTFQWVDAGDCSCDITAWQDTASVVRCAKDASNNNTGYQEKKQKDMNPCSATYNQARWVSIGLNTTACPLPPPPCTGADRMIISGSCVIGQRVNTAAAWNPSMQKFSCTYHYEWQPNCIKGSNIVEYTTQACTLGNACIPD